MRLHRERKREKALTLLERSLAVGHLLTARQTAAVLEKQQQQQNEEKKELRGEQLGSLALAVFQCFSLRSNVRQLLL